MNYKILLICLIVGVLSPLVGGRIIAETFYLQAAADADVQQLNPDYAKGDRTELKCQNSVTFPERNSKIYFKFYLPQGQGEITHAEFKITPTYIYDPDWNFIYNLHGLKENFVPENGEPNEDWTEYHSLTWNNAPANETDNGYGFTDDATLPLGQIIGGYQAGTTRQLSTQGLINFLNQDTNGVVTLMLAREQDSSVSEKWASRENATYSPPELVVSYGPIDYEASLDADADIREDSPYSSIGDRIEHRVRNCSGQSAKLYMRFILPENFGQAFSAEFQITRSQVGSSDLEYELYGLKDMLNGQDWIEDQLIWLNAPANIVNDGNSLDPQNVVFLGSFQSSSQGNPGDQFVIQESALKDFLNDGTDRVVTLALICKQDNCSSDYFASKESPYYEGPKLTLGYLPSCGLNYEEDFNRDCYINNKDYSGFADFWLESNIQTDGNGQMDYQLPVNLGLQLWLDASKTNTIVSADGVLDNGDKVAGWNDILTVTNTTADNAVQSDPNKQPLWVQEVSDLNDNSVIRFDGGSTYLNIDSLYIDSSMTIFVVSQDSVQTKGGDLQRPLFSADNNPWRTTGNGYGICYTKDGDNFIQGVLGDGSRLNRLSENVKQDSSYHIIIMSRDGDQNDGTTLYKRTIGNLATAVPSESTQFKRLSGFRTGYDIGANPPEHNGDVSRFYLGDIAEIILYDRLLTNSERQAVQDYLFDRYLDPKICDHPAMYHITGDVNKDCKVNIDDLKIFFSNWLDCTDESNIDCESLKYKYIAQQFWNDWRASWNTFPLAAWSYFPRYDGTLDEYQTYKNANLTMVQAPIDQINNAIDAGLKVVSGINLYESRPRLKLFMDYPTEDCNSVCALMLDDEPDLTLFDEIGEQTRYIYDNDNRGSIPFVNLQAGNLIYLDSYLEMVNPAVLCYDHYPIYFDGTDRTTFYSTMERFRQRSLEAGIGFMGFPLVTAHKNTYRQPSESDLRWQVYSFITYGAKGIWYYNYRIGDPDFDEGMVTHADGTPTETYYLVKDVNAELQALGPILLQLKSTDVFHTGLSIPDGTVQYEDGCMEAFNSFSGDEFIIGAFENQDFPGDDVYIMIMNKRHSANTTSLEEAAVASFTLKQPYSKVYKYESLTGNQVELTQNQGVYSLTINGGQGILLRITQD
jgi:hypothetical protein